MLLTILSISIFIVLTTLILIKKWHHIMFSEIPHPLGVIWTFLFIASLVISVSTLWLVCDTEIYTVPDYYEKLNQFIGQNPDGYIINSLEKTKNITKIKQYYDDYNSSIDCYHKSSSENYYGNLWFLRPDTLLKYPKFIMKDTTINNQYIIKLREQIYVP